MIRSFVKLQSQNPGFSADRVLAMRLSPNFSKYTQPQQLTNLNNSILQQVREVSGVQAVATASSFPFNPAGVAQGPGNTFFEIEGRPISKGEVAPQVDVTVVSASYFQTLRQPMVAGREFTEHDDAKALPVAIVNQTMVRHRWPAEDPIGKRISVDQGKTWIQIVGVVADAKEYGLERAVHDEVYAPVLQNGFANNLVIRTAGDPMSVAAAIRAAIHSVDPQLAIDRMNTIERFASDSMASPRVTAILLGLFAGLAVIISACGIAAVMALSVSQRFNELGIRMALGASRESIVYMVVRQGLTLAIAGTAVGLAGAIALTRLLSSLLYATSPTDAVTFVAVSLLFLTVAAIASFIPARQVTAIDPLKALRQE
jgi:putative ABC transport system permease protein